jgi:TPR repeat protein
MRFTNPVLSTLLFLISAAAAAENYNRPPFYYPGPASGYPYPYPATQGARTPPTVMLQQVQQVEPQKTTLSETAPELPTMEETATELTVHISPQSDILVIDEELDNPVTTKPASVALPSASVTPVPDENSNNTLPTPLQSEPQPELDKLQAAESNAPLQSREDPPAVGTVTAIDKHSESATDGSPVAASQDAVAEIHQQPFTEHELPADQATTATTDVSDILEVSDGSGGSDESVMEPAVPATIAPSLAEQRLSRSQPLIESAIRSGNFAEAYYLWRPLAEAGDASAQYGIGWMYHNGYGLSIDDRKAYEWWSKAAAQNYVEAIFSIGTLYQFGYGVMKKEMHIALGYYLMATVAGHEESRLILKTMLERGDAKIKPILAALLRYHLYSTITGDHESATILNQMLIKRDQRIAPIQTRLLSHHLNATIAGDSESHKLLKQMVQINDVRITEILPELLTHYRDSAIAGDKESQQILRTLMLKGDKRAEVIVAELLQSHPKILGNIPATVRVASANTRMGPGTNHKVIKVVKQGDELIVIDRQDGWLFTQLSDSDKRVWIAASLVTLNP